MTFPFLQIITNLATAVKELLMLYYVENGKQKPKAILMYRDGVAESQFKEVLRYELNAIKEACASLELDYSPLVTFVTVQKRSNAVANHPLNFFDC